MHMSLKRIAVRAELPPGEGDLEAVMLACRVARELEAEVSVILYATEVLPGSASVNVTPAELAEINERLAAIGSNHGVKLSVHERSSDAHGSGEVFADLLRVSDLGVLLYAAQPSITQRMLAPTVIFDGGVPIVLLPRAMGFDRMPKSILVGWDGSPAAARALRGAILLGAPRRAITVASIDESPKHRSGRSGVEAAHLAAMHGAISSFVTLKGDGRHALDVLESHCSENGIDLLAAGAVRHGANHQVIFGSLTSEILSRGPSLPTLLAG